MHSKLTIRLPGSLLGKLDRKATTLGRSKAEHVRHMIEADVAAKPAQRKRFACLALKGRYALGRGSDNATVRRAPARRA
jgi:hypothetical protein